LRAVGRSNYAAGAMTSTLRLVAAFVMAAAVAAAQPKPAPTALARFEVVEKTLPELQDAMRRGEVTSRQLVELYLARIAAYDRQGPRLNAIVALNARALDEAAALDRERAAKGARGPLHGVPVLVKDNYETVGMPTTAGTLALATFHPKRDAFLVKRLRDAGAVIVGKTNMHELAAGITSISSIAGQTRNPYDLARNPGGSSGGTGAAVAASFAAAGMGSDTCGSIRIPSSHNNLVGLRGTRGLSSRQGIVPLSHTQDIGGPLARTITDLALMLDATVGPDPADDTTTGVQTRIPRSYTDALRPDALKGARVGILKTLFGEAPEDEEVAGIVRKALEAMQKQGAETIEVTVPGLSDLLRDSSLINAEFKFDLLDYLAANPDAPIRSLADIVDRGLEDAALESNFKTRNAVPERDSDARRRALVRRDALRNAVVSALDEQRLVALVYPSLRLKPQLIGQAQAGSNCSLSAHSGLPALAVTAGFSDDGLPIGMELLGRPFSEPELLAIGYAYEQAARLRRAPFSTPPLVEGKAPAPITFEIVAGHRGQATKSPSMRARFTYDALVASLRYDVNLSGIPRDEVLLVALHQGEREESGPVQFRLVEAGATAGNGGLTLGFRQREAIAAGNLYVKVYTRTSPLGTLRAAVKLPHQLVN
jgi:amidase